MDCGCLGGGMDGWAVGWIAFGEFFTKVNIVNFF